MKATVWTRKFSFNYLKSEGVLGGGCPLGEASTLIGGFQINSWDRGGGTHPPSLWESLHSEPLKAVCY